MPLHSCSLLPCSAPLKHNSAFGRHALHRRPSYSCRQSRRHRNTCIEAKKKGQQKASKRFGNQTFELKTPDAEAGESDLTDYLRMGRALGESPAEVEKTLKARGVAVNWDTKAQNYMQQWQDEEMSEYAAAAGIMARLAQQAAPQSRANAKLQKNKQKVGANDTVIEFAQREMTARDVSKRFKPLTVLKANKGKAAPGVTLAQRPTRGTSSGSASGEDDGGMMLLSRPRPASEDEARWSQQAVQGGFDIKDDSDDDAFLSSADDGPPALSYEDFEALLNAPKAPPKAKQSPPSKPAATPSLQLNRPQSSVPKGQRSQASSSSTPATSSSFVKEDAPVLSSRPGMYWQEKPSLPEATPAAPLQGPPPKLVGRPAKPTPPPAQVEAQNQVPQEEEDQQLSAAVATPQEPPPTLVGRPAQPTPQPPPPAQVEEQRQKPTEEELEEVGSLAGAAPPQDRQPMQAQRPAKPSAIPAQKKKEQQLQEMYSRQQLSAAAAPLQEPPPTLVGRLAQPTPPPAPPAQVEEQQQKPTEEELEEVGSLAGAAPPQDPQPMQAQRPAKPSAIPAQKKKEQQSQERYSRQQLSVAAAPPQEPPPMLVGRPAKPIPPPAQVSQEITDEQQMLKEQEEVRDRLLSADSTQESSEDAQRAAPTLHVPKQEPQSVAEAPARLRSDGAKTGKAKNEPRKLFRPQLLPQAEEKQQPRISRPAPRIPALARPAPSSPAIAKEAAVDSQVAAAVSRIKERGKSRRLQTVAAEKAAAEKAAKPSLQLISPPSRSEKPSVANLTNPVAWGLMDFEKFVAENPSVIEHKRRNHLYRQSVEQKAQQEGPQLPPPTLADRPARPPPTKAGTYVQKSLTVAEWPQEAVLQYAEYAMEGERRLTVFVTGANGGGVMVQSRKLRGFIPTTMLSQESYTKVAAREAELLQEKGMPADAPEEEVRKLRVEALRCLIQTILTATIVNVLPGHRIIMSERPPEDLSNNPSQQQPDADHLAVLRDNLGQVVEGVVVEVRPFGCFMEFDVEAEGGNKHKVCGMVHVSEVSWDYCEDARLRVKHGQDVEAILMGVDSSSGKVWLSMRQVLPDPLQETLDALLAQGPPSDALEDGVATEGSRDDTEYLEGSSSPEDEASMAFQEALEVAEALVLLPGVDAVAPGRQLFTRAAAKDLQVYMSSVPLADFAASITAEEQALDSSSSSDEEDLNEETDSDAVSASAASSPSTLEAEDAATSELQQHQTVQSSVDATVEQQPLKMSNASDGTPREDVTDGEQLTSEAADIASGDGADVLGASTLIVRKGQQLQELVVSGSITQEKLRDEIEKIVSFLLSPEDLM